MSEKDVDTTKLHGSVFLIQEVIPTRLVGSVGGETSLAGLGILTVGLIGGVSSISINSGTSEVTVRLPEDIALDIATRLLHVVAQNRALRELSRVQGSALFSENEQK